MWYLRTPRILNLAPAGVVCRGCDLFVTIVRKTPGDVNFKASKQK